MTTTCLEVGTIRTDGTTGSFYLHGMQFKQPLRLRVRSTVLLSGCLLFALGFGGTQAAQGCQPLDRIRVTLQTPFPAAEVNLVDRPTLAAAARRAALPSVTEQAGQDTTSAGGVLWHRVGLWRGTLEMSYDYRILVSPAGRSSTCAQVQSARLTVGFVSNQIMISQDIANDGCRYDVTLAHERQHAALARQTLDDYAVVLQDEVVPQLKAISAARAANLDQASDEIAGRWKEIMDGFFQRLRAAHDRAQAALDTPQEYRRLQALCR